MHLSRGCGEAASRKLGEVGWEDAKHIASRVRAGGAAPPVVAHHLLAQDGSLIRTAHHVANISLIPLS